MRNRNITMPASTYALVTGASEGIGWELAKILAQHGHHLVLVARNETKLNQLADELQAQNGVSVVVLPADLSLDNSVQQIITELKRRSLHVDLLVNNAGIDVYGKFSETDLTTELGMIQLNLVALTQLTKMLLGDMLVQGYGRILNLGSTGSFIPAPLNAVYSATKAYVLSFSEAIAAELRGSGVTVTALCPGATRTQFQQRAGMEGIRLLRFGVMRADHVAEIGYRAMMAGKPLVVPGWINQLQVLLARLLPRRLTTRIAGLMLQT